MRRFKKLAESNPQKREKVEHRKPGEFIRKVMRGAELSPLWKARHAKKVRAVDLSSSCMRQQIITSYLNTLECLKSPIRSESELPFPKQDIQSAIVEELLLHPDSDLRGHLEVAYAEIESFIPVEEYELLQRFKETCSHAEQLAERGAPKDIVAGSRLMDRIPGEEAVGVLERTSKAMRERLEIIRSIGLLHVHMGFENASST
jgi:hypothetical protein